MNGFGIACVHVPGDADAGIIGEDAFDAGGHLRRAVGDDYLPRMLRIADADAASIVDGNPGRAARGVSMAFRKGQSATASEPSRIASVSR